MTSLDTVVQLLNQLVLDNKGLKEQLTAVEKQLAALQSAPVSRPRGKAPSTTPVGVTTNGHVEPKFPIHTVAWLKVKTHEDPTFLQQIIGSTNYDRFVQKYEADLKTDDPKERASKLAEKIWKDMQALGESCPEPATKEFAAKMTKHLRDSWRKERDAWDAAHPTTAAPAAATGAVVVPDTPVMQVLEQSSLVQPLLTPMPLQMPLLQPVGTLGR